MRAAALVIGMKCHAFFLSFSFGGPLHATFHDPQDRRSDDQFGPLVCWRVYFVAMLGRVRVWPRPSQESVEPIDHHLVVVVPASLHTRTQRFEMSRKRQITGCANGLT